MDSKDKKTRKKGITLRITVNKVKKPVSKKAKKMLKR